MIIYSHLNTITNKRYIGQTKHSIQSRFFNHIKEALHGSEHPFHKDLLKYPLNSWISEIVEETNDQKETHEREIYWTEFYDSYNNGYNITKGGIHGWDYINENRIGEHHPMYGKKHSQETRDKIRNALKGKKQSVDTNKKRSESLKGRPSPMKGKKRSPESIAKGKETQRKNRENKLL